MPKIRIDIEAKTVAEIRTVLAALGASDHCIIPMSVGTVRGLDKPHTPFAVEVDKDPEPAPSAAELPEGFTPASEPPGDHRDVAIAMRGTNGHVRAWFHNGDDHWTLYNKRGIAFFERSNPHMRKNIIAWREIRDGDVFVDPVAPEGEEPYV